MTQNDLNQYVKRMRQAKKAWLTADPNNKELVNQTWKTYQQAKQNYLNVKGV